MAQTTISLGSTDDKIYSAEELKAFLRNPPKGLIKEEYGESSIVNVYIEYWGMENDSKYLKRKK